MTDSLVVLMEDQVAGTLVRARGGRLTFTYSEEYREQEGATPLSVSMPTQIPSHPDRIVTAWLWGLLPDNDAVLRRWAREFHVSAGSPFSLLGTPVGEDCPGAVRFFTPENVERALRRTGDVSWLTEEQVAGRLRELRQDSTAWLGRSFTGQFSLAGAQAKTALLFRDGKWGVPSGAAATTHILKPAVTGLDDHDLNEHLCLDAARRAGLTAARTQIAGFAEQTAVVVTRYDRRLAAERVIRVHQEDLCQALAVPPAQKYQNEGGPGAREIAALLRRAMPPRVAQAAVWAFADALAWNWLIAGTDAHAKNYSLLLAGNQVRLAPLYDIASALPYDTHERKLRMAMKIGGDHRLLPYNNPWPVAARDLDLDAGALLDRVLELADRAPDAFADAAGTQQVKRLKRKLPGKLVELVAERAARCRRLLGQPGKMQ
ncbi:MAG TPA: type II toxin-antitoxin system HipA family toxin [Solirubrobacteraceae bacterium]